MSDPVQPALQQLALSGSLPRELAIFCAAYLIFVLAAGWVVALVVHRDRVTLDAIARIALLMVVAFIVAKVLNQIISDPRPFVVEHTQPLAPVSHDNGFPSDHTLFGAALTASLWWIRRQLMPLFALGTLLVMAGRLAIEAHHSLDVLGSVAIVLVVALLIAALPLPRTWERPVLASARSTRR